MTRMLRRAAACAVVTVVTAAWSGWVSPQTNGQTVPQPAGDSTPHDGMTVALTGDSIITMKLSVHTEPAFTRMIELIRGADVAFTNLEMLFHDYEPYPSTQSGGTYMRADPALASEVAWAGFDMVARANNHANDYGVDGMRATTKHVAAAGLVQAGVGESLREAREAKYLDTGKGRVALISIASTFPDPSRAGESWGDTRARPGLNPLRFTTTHVLTRQQFDALQGALKGAGLLSAAPASQDADQMTVFQQRFAVGETRRTRTEPLKEDIDAILAVVRNAHKQADYTIVNSHTHEGGADRFMPPEFFVTFAHAAVDAGADVVTASGPHVLRGIEIYKGKPILYGLGNFIFENETLLRQPPENYEPLGMSRDSGVGDFNDRRSNNDQTGFPADERVWQSVIAVPRFADRKLAELRLYPIVLGFKQPRPDRGWPALAPPDVGGKIINDIVKASVPFGTVIQFRDGVGLVEVGSTKSQN